MTHTTQVTMTHTTQVTADILTQTGQRRETVRFDSDRRLSDGEALYAFAVHYGAKVQNVRLVSINFL